MLPQGDGKLRHRFGKVNHAGDGKAAGPAGVHVTDTVHGRKGISTGAHAKQQRQGQPQQGFSEIFHRHRTAFLSFLLFYTTTAEIAMKLPGFGIAIYFKIRLW